MAIGALGITTLTGFVDLQSTTPILAVMLGLAVGIDYALFIFTRFRQELARPGRPGTQAAATAVGTPRARPWSPPASPWSSRWPGWRWRASRS